MWNERYSTKDYVYGTQPNDFLKKHIASIPTGKILSLAEGEGRNAVYLAKQGFAVTAVDTSSVGIEKAKKLAKKNAVAIDFIHADLADYDFGNNQWDAIISIFCPLPSLVRREIHKNVIHGLKHNGVFLLEAYTPEQLRHATGGGNNIDLMQSKESLTIELNELEFQHLIELERDVIEGTYHTGTGAVVQAIARKV